MMAAEHVDKVRINPGNFADKKRFAVREYTDAEYLAELARIERVFVPLVLRCKELGVSMRIGTNHGSLSDRILNRYGDTPEGMVESALEFVRMCESQGYRDLILSMKASNPIVVLRAYRHLVDRMAAEGMDYPLHLGVTEAGDGEDARIKSAIGIGALLDEGLGDTVRVSLTEDPVAEVPVAQALVEPYNRRIAADHVGAPRPSGTIPLSISTEPYERRATTEVRIGPRRVGGSNAVLVEVPLLTPATDHDEIRRELDAQSGVRVPEDTRAELVSVAVPGPEAIEGVERLRRSMELVAPRVALSGRLTVEPGTLADADLERLSAAVHRLHVRVRGPVHDASRNALRRLLALTAAAGRALLVEGSSETVDDASAVEIAIEAARLARAGEATNLLLAIDPSAVASPLLATRRLTAELDAAHLRVPVVLIDRPLERDADPLLGPALALGGLLCEGIGDAILVETASAAESRRLVFGILQAARVRITRTEFISCPSCGRTLFDLEETTARIKARTAHLKGVKIAVMGCIVNGPGEMADADFGYVGWGEEKIALFVRHEMVAKDIPTEEADQRLVDLIKKHGRWVDPPVPAETT
jgi:(E)-4-hydroxy-3-methylbut-2-enyl-diphosphate synthase